MTSKSTTEFTQMLCSMNKDKLAILKISFYVQEKSDNIGKFSVRAFS